MRLRSVIRDHWDRVGAIAALVGGIGALAFGWSGVADSVYPAEQIPYVVSGAIGGLFLLGVAATVWLSADLRDQWSKLDDLERGVSQAGGIPSTAEERDDDRSAA